MPFYQQGRSQAFVGVRQFARFVRAYQVPVGEQYYSGRNLGAALRWAMAHDYNVAVDVVWRSLDAIRQPEGESDEIVIEASGTGRVQCYGHGINPDTLIGEIEASGLSPADYFRERTLDHERVIDAQGFMGYVVTYIPVEERR